MAYGDTTCKTENLYQDLKNSIVYGQDSRIISNREQGCLQVGGNTSTYCNSRRKSTQSNYHQSAKNLKGCKAAIKNRAITNRVSNYAAVVSKSEFATNDKSVEKPRMNVAKSPMQNSSVSFAKKRESVLVQARVSVEPVDKQLNLNQTVILDKSPLSQIQNRSTVSNDRRQKMMNTSAAMISTKREEENMTPKTALVQKHFSQASMK